MSILILNDLHLGVSRSAGTTPATAEALRQSLQVRFEHLIMQHTNLDIVIAGDLFDGFTVDIRDVLRCYNTLAEWLAASQHNLYLVAGNHDHSMKGDRLSSFHFLANILTRQFSHRVNVIDHTTGLAQINDKVWAIPHMPNQDLFDLELQKAEVLRDVILILHANWDNKFAEAADHSLNVPREFADKMEERNVTLLFAHEHAHRKPLGNVMIMGNQFPSSIADCLMAQGMKDGKKYAHVIQRDGNIECIVTWDRIFGYTELEWPMLDQYEGQHEFVRVVGEATAEQASAVVDAIARFRTRNTDAFVVGNGVKVEGVAEMNDLPEMFDAAKRFDVLSYLLEQLEPKEQEVVKRMTEELK